MLTGIWEEFLKIVKEEAGSRVVDTWFKAVTLQAWDGRVKIVYLQAPNAFVRDWIHTHYVGLIQVHLGRLLHVTTPKIIISTHETVDIKNGTVKADTDLLVPARPLDSKPGTIIKSSEFKGQGYSNRGYTFETFVVGPNNSLAYAAAHAITEKPGRLYNPLFVYGGSGLGKTHLMHAIGNSIKRDNKNAVIVYQTADRFVNEFINAIRFDKIHIFQEKYRGIDVLLVDDVQFISNKEQTQEAFFHIFNSLYESHKQIVFSSDTYPHNLNGIAERLRSRLSSGLVVDMHMPSLETKIAILKQKAAMSDENLPDEVAHYIASCVVANVRELEGALIRVMAFASLTKQPISLDLARRVLVRLHESVQRVDINDFDRIVQCVRKHYSYELSELKSKARSKELSFVRQVTMFLMKKVTNKSLRDIGDFLGGRDHSTVMHAISKVELYAQTDIEFCQRLKHMEHELAG